MMKRQLVVAAVVGSFALAGSAAAETKSWAAIKNKLPANAIGAASIDVKTIRGLPGFKDVMAGIWAMPQMAEPRTIVETVASVCKIDVIAAISDIAIGITKREKEMVFAIGLDGVDEAKLADCVLKMGKTKTPTATLASKTVGGLREYTFGDTAKKGVEKIYAVWPSKDVLILTGRPMKPESYDNYTSGKAPAGDLASFIGKGSAVATPLFWLALVDPKMEEGMKGGFGALSFGKLTLNGTGRIFAVDGAAQKKLLDDAKKDLARTVGKAPPVVAKVLGAIKLGGAGNEITIDVAVPEAELSKIVPELLKAL